jgi:hypothetical protein
MNQGMINDALGGTRAPPRWRRQDLLIASAVFGVIGASLILLAPAKPLGERASAAVA